MRSPSLSHTHTHTHSSFLPFFFLRAVTFNMFNTDKYLGCLQIKSQTEVLLFLLGATCGKARNKEQKQRKKKKHSHLNA